MSRPQIDPTALDALATLGVATVYEASGRAGLVDVPLRSIVPESRVAGPARTVRCGQGDNLMVHAAIEHIRRGDVLVLSMPEPAPVALVGDLLATQALVHGAAALLIDAAARDVAELRELGLPIWTRFVRVRAASKRIRGAIDVPVTVGGATVRPGDVVVLDDDGAVVVAADQVERTLEQGRARLEKEERMRARLRAGELSLDIHGLRDRVEGEAS